MPVSEDSAMETFPKATFVSLVRRLNEFVPLRRLLGSASRLKPDWSSRESLNCFATSGREKVVVVAKTLFDVVTSSIAGDVRLSD